MLLAAALLASLSTAHAAPPVVSNVRASQRPGTKYVDIYYDLSDPDSSAISIAILVSKDAGSTWTVPAYSFSGAQGGNISPGINKYVVWNAGNDWDGQYTAQCRVRVIANDADLDGFVLIPAGSSTRGDFLNDGGSNEQPTNTVYISAFEMEKTEVSYTRWNAVYQWAIIYGYTFDHAGAAKAPTHPVHTMTWFDAVKWCNARSQFEGRTPCYYTDAGLTTVYKSGQVAPYVQWTANGYRLPTEAEWEKAARGGLSGKRFPWGDTITTNQANILNNATPRSLIVLDEIGRGTSTFDGLSLAWSIVEHLHNQVGAKTLFATHYHELTELAQRLPRLKNFNVAVREWHDQIVFLRKIVEGGTDKSYGIHVARLAGVPKEVLERAKVILGNLEESELTPEGTVRQSRRQQDRDKLRQLTPPQMDLFGG